MTKHLTVLAADTANYPKDSRYLWNPEVIWPVERYLKSATPDEKAAVLESFRKGHGIITRTRPTSIARSRLTSTLVTLAVALLCGFPAASAGSDATTLTVAGWTIDAHSDSGRLTIKHERLGTILSEVQLNLEADGALRELNRWSVEITGPQALPSSSSASKVEKWTPESAMPGLLLVRTVDPPSTWIFEPTRDELKISSTAPGAVLTGQAAVSKVRQLARLLDSDGVPVTWRGTGECAGTYGGGLTQNPSFLPRENPECMYFALGQASGAVFHNLFDQKTNTAIRFTPQTRFSAGGTGAKQLKFTMPLRGPGQIRLVPDYYTIHHYPVVLDLKVAAQSGTYDVVALPNWRSAPITKDVSLSRQLGLDPGEKYVAFDFWNQALLGVVTDRMTIKVEGHDTRVLLVHRLLDHPQLIGTSRHITGAYSIQDLSWDVAGTTLQGISDVVPDADYTLFIHIPPGTTATPQPTATASGNPIKVRQKRNGNLLSVAFMSPKSQVSWAIKF